MRAQLLSATVCINIVSFAASWTLPSLRTTVPRAGRTIESQEKSNTPPTILDFRQQVLQSSPVESINEYDNEPQFTVMDAFSGDGVPYSGLASFAHLNWTDCYDKDSDGTFDIAFAGMPFDLGVTYRPGARFGPGAVRMASRRLLPDASYDVDHRVNPFRDWASVVDCGDVSNSPFDKALAVKQLTHGATSILSRSAAARSNSSAVRMIAVGGDHTITLPILRATYPIWGPVAVLHFDSHLDTWDPKKMAGDDVNKYSQITHGTMLHLAHEEGLMSNNSNMHLGCRSMLFDSDGDLENDARCGFDYIRARQIDDYGVDGVVDRILNRVGDQYVYVSIDIDVLDPAFAPATGTIEPGGWSTRELLRILQGLSEAGVKIIGADVVEFSPVYDNRAETTALLITEIVFELLQWMVEVPVPVRASNL